MRRSRWTTLWVLGAVSSGWGCGSSPTVGPAGPTTLALSVGGDVIPLACHDRAWRADASGCPIARAGPALLAVEGPRGSCTGPVASPRALDADVMSDPVLTRLISGQISRPLEGLTGHQSARFDADGDGTLDEFLIVSADVDEDAVLLVVRAGDPPMVVARTAESVGLFELGACADADGDGRPEVLLALGGETEQTYALVEWGEVGLVTLGEAHLGD